MNICISKFSKKFRFGVKLAKFLRFRALFSWRTNSNKKSETGLQIHKLRTVGVSRGQWDHARLQEDILRVILSPSSVLASNRDPLKWTVKHFRFCLQSAKSCTITFWGNVLHSLYTSCELVTQSHSLVTKYKYVKEGTAQVILYVFNHLWTSPRPIPS